MIAGRRSPAAALVWAAAAIAATCNQRSSLRRVAAAPAADRSRIITSGIQPRSDSQ